MLIPKSRTTREVNMVATMPGQSAPKQVVAALPFRYGAQVVDDAPYDQQLTSSAGTQTFLQYEVPSTAFLKNVFVYVTGTVTANVTNSVTYTGDTPWTVLDSIQLTDTNNSPIIGPINGWDLYIINKYGGYTFSDDAKNNIVYSAVTGTGATAGSFAFILRLPVELVARDAVGTLENKSASTPFKVKVNLANQAAFYGVAPSTQTIVRLRMTPESYWQPQATSPSGQPQQPNPPGVGTTQFWVKQDLSQAAGAMNLQLASSVGFPIRNLIFVLRDSTGSRVQGEADFPDPFRLRLDANTLLDKIKAIWQYQIQGQYGYGAGTLDTVNVKDNSVYPVPYCQDFSHKVGWETRRGYLKTTTASRLTAQGTIGGSGLHNLSVYTNYVGTAAGVTLDSLIS